MTMPIISTNNMILCFVFFMIFCFCQICNAAQFKFVSIAFDEGGAPTSITCKFIIPFDKATDLAPVLLAPDRIEYGTAKIKVSKPRDGQIVIEACIDLSRTWVSDISKPLSEGDWKLPIIDGKKSQIADDKGFVKVLEISSTMQVGFSLGRPDLDEDAKAFLKSLDPRPTRTPGTIHDSERPVPVPVPK